MQLELFFGAPEPSVFRNPAQETVPSINEELDMNPFLADAKAFWDQPEPLMRYRKVLHQDLLEAQSNHEGDLVHDLMLALREIKSRLGQIVH